MAEHVVELRGRARVWPSGRRGSGSFGSGRTAGYAIGEGRTSPWLEAIAGIRQRPCPRLGSKPVPAPRTRHEVRDMSPSGSHRRDRLKHPLPSASKCVRGERCAGEFSGQVLGVSFLVLGSCVCLVLSWVLSSFLGSWCAVGRQGKDVRGNASGHLWCAGEFLGPVLGVYHS